MTDQTTARDPIEEPLAEALAVVERGDAEGAVRMLQSLLQRFPKSGRAWLALGAIWTDPLKNAEGAVESFTNATILDPQHQVASVALFHGLIAVNRFDGALAEAQRFLALHEAGVPLDSDHLATYRDIVSDPEGMKRDLLAHGYLGSRPAVASSDRGR
ncbi:MAG: tetratricopeptide repeat protein [Myxococcales bacterium]|nr:tetratricopeptide repeat protein [Myxococcales bacterium]